MDTHISHGVLEMQHVFLLSTRITQQLVAIQEWTVTWVTLSTVLKYLT
jgi:hypothetical protein